MFGAGHSFLLLSVRGQLNPKRKGLPMRQAFSTANTSMTGSLNCIPIFLKICLIYLQMLSGFSTGLGLDKCSTGRL